MDATLADAREQIFAPRRGARLPRPQPVPDTVVGLAPDAAAVVWGSVRSTVGPDARRILVVHGWEGASTQFAVLAGRLRERGLATVGVDAPAHGHAPDGPFSPVRYAAALRTAERRFGTFAGVVAHSFGSVAVHAAMADGLRVPALALLAPVRSMSERVGMIADHHGVHGPARARFLAMVETRLGRPLDELDLDRRAVPACPVLICHDGADREVPPESSRLLADTWERAVLRESDGLRHRGPLVDPATLDAVVDHLTDGQ